MSRRDQLYGALLVMGWLAGIVAAWLGLRAPRWR